MEHLNEPTEPAKQMDQEVQDKSQKGSSPATAALVSPPVTVPDEDPPLPPPADPPKTVSGTPSIHRLEDDRSGVGGDRRCPILISCDWCKVVHPQ